MNARIRRVRLEQSKYNTSLGIKNVVCTFGHKAGLEKLQTKRTELAKKADGATGINGMKSFVVDGKWFLTISGDVHEIVSPKPKNVQKCHYVLPTEQFLEFAGIKAFSSRPIK